MAFGFGVAPSGPAAVKKFWGCHWRMNKKSSPSSALQSLFNGINRTRQVCTQLKVIDGDCAVHKTECLIEYYSEAEKHHQRVCLSLRCAFKIDGFRTLF